MALIKCVECGAEVSNQAEKCPKCAYPIATQQAENKTQVIEQTSKKLKFQMLISMVVLFGGFPVLFVNTTIGISLIVVGFILVIATKISVWWHHQ